VAILSGGYLSDGIALGRLARSLGATTVANGSCSSSCAIAFLGRRERAIFRNSSLMFHAPYTRSDKDPNKITYSKNLTNVANYYREMLGGYWRLDWFHQGESYVDESNLATLDSTTYSTCASVSSGRI